MDPRKVPTKKQRRRLSQRPVPVHQAEPADEPVPVEEAQVAEEQPVEQANRGAESVPVQAQAVAKQPADEPILGEAISLDDLLKKLDEAFVKLNVSADNARRMFGKDFGIDIEEAKKKLAPLKEHCERAKEEGQEVPGAPSLGIDVSFHVDEATRARIYRENASPHFHFAERAFDYLLTCYGLRVPSHHRDELEYERFMGEAILSFCILYRDEWREKFRAIHATLMKLEHFVLYSCAVPVERDSHYFYNYLMRVAIVFEMAVYCFDYDYDYFQIAQTCAGLFVDEIFFRDEGGWASLKIAASVMATVTRPLRFVVGCPKGGAGGFSDVVERLEEYASRGVINMTSRERSLLQEVNERLLQTPETGCDYVEELARRYKEMSYPMLMPYFEDYLPENYPISLELQPLGIDSLIDVEAWLHEGHEYDKVFKSHKALQQGRLDASNYRYNINYIDRVIDLENLTLGVSDLPGATQSDSAAAKPARRHAPVKKTGTVPKRRNTVPRRQPVSENYVQFNKLHVERFVELYFPLPSFLHNFVVEYLSPNYGLSASEEGEHFIIDGLYYEERQAVLPFPESHKRMVGCLLPGREPVVVPIRVQRLLDTYAYRYPEAKARMYSGGRSVLAVPKIPESVNGNGPVWVIQGSLTKHGSSMGKAAESMDKFREMLKTRHFRTSKAETDEASIHMFRLKTASETKIRLPENAVAWPLSQYLPRQAPSSKRRKPKKKSRK